MRRIVAIILSALALLLTSSESAAKDKTDGKRGKMQRNLPVNYGLTPDWDVGISFLNAQFASLNSSAILFRLDVLLNVEKQMIGKPLFADQL